MSCMRFFDVSAAFATFPAIRIQLSKAWQVTEDLSPGSKGSRGMMLVSEDPCAVAGTVSSAVASSCAWQDWQGNYGFWNLLKNWAGYHLRTYWTQSQMKLMNTGMPQPPNTPAQHQVGWMSSRNHPEYRIQKLATTSAQSPNLQILGCPVPVRCAHLQGASLSSHSVLASRFQNSQTVSPLLLPRFDELGAANALQPRQAVTNPCRSINTRSLSHCWRNESNQWESNSSVSFPKRAKSKRTSMAQPSKRPLPPWWSWSCTDAVCRRFGVGYSLVGWVGLGSVSLACKAKSI